MYQTGLRRILVKKYNFHPFWRYKNLVETEEYVKNRKQYKDRVLVLYIKKVTDRIGKWLILCQNRI